MSFSPDAYFARIGYDGEGYDGKRVPTLAVLTTLHDLHVRAIPFENLDPLLGRPVMLEREAIAAKLIGQRRGGYCFEQNSLLYDILAGLGFKVTALAARVVWRLPENAPRPPLSHRLTLVELPEGRFIADVGFGGPGLTAPIRLDTADDQVTPHGRYRIVIVENNFQIELRLPDHWERMYHFVLTRQEARDYEVSNWYTSTNPNSIFRQHLTLARIVGTDRMHLRDRTFTIYAPDGSTQETEVKTPTEMQALLTECFGIEPPVPVEELWARLPTP